MTLQKTNSVAQPLVKPAHWSEFLVGLIEQATWRGLLSGTRVGMWRQKWVFQVALRRTYSRFAAVYPQWVACLFDKHFVTCYLTPLLEPRYLQQQVLPEAAELAKAWDKELGLVSLEVRQRRVAELTPVAGEFIRWLDGELQKAI
jgi:hypothetical protein